MDKVTVFWFRRDLRLEDNIGFNKALQGKFPVLPIFIFDSEILNDLPLKDPRLTFISETLQKMRSKLLAFGSNLAIYKGTPKSVFENIISEYQVQRVIANTDYEAYAVNRDSLIKKFLLENDIDFYTFKDQVIFEKDEIVKADGTPYIVFTPYMKIWKERYRKDYQAKKYPTQELFENLHKNTKQPNLLLRDIGFQKSHIEIPAFTISSTFIQHYDLLRNFPAEEATSYLGPHLRFGTVSIRHIIRMATLEKNEVFWQELIWREFFMQILWHFPETATEAFKKKYDRIEWRNNKMEFEKWKEGKTGYPLVDAGMRQLNTTGFMHNRVRMVVASFLCKHLLIDWRWGEAYFAEKLLDYEMASNVGNWQWAAGSGADAAPYFRIFNPQTQMEKFDKDLRYVKKWIPEFGTENYPPPMVDHKEARERCLSTYKAVLS